jgi:hypothetical protein
VGRIGPSIRCDGPLQWGVSGPGGRFYDENDAEEILRLAARHGTGDKVDKDRLLSMAAELGISPEAVERAEAELVEKRAAEAASKIDVENRAEYRRQRRRDLWNNVGSYVSINALMVVIWFFTDRGYFWPFWVIFPWGLGVVPQIFIGLGRGSDRDYERWKRKRFGRSEPDEEFKENVRAVLDELATRRETGKLMVIKELRERTGVDLRTAKDAVDQYAATHDDVVW